MNEDLATAFGTPAYRLYMTPALVICVSSVIGVRLLRSVIAASNRFFTWRIGSRTERRMSVSQPQRPKLRNVEAKRVEKEGIRYFVITDPRRVASQALMVSEELGPFLAHADGTMTIDQIIGATRKRMSGDSVTNEQERAVKELFERLDALFLLEGERYDVEVARQLEEYRAADFRAPALETLSYPADPDDLIDLFDGFAPHISDDQEPSDRALKAIVTPHIDFERGGDTYAELWRQAAPELEDVELAVIFGTDHNGPGPRLTLTRQSYATPWNIMPTDKDLVGRLAEILERDPDVANHAFAGEFNHVHEHSIELASIWLNWAVDDRAVQVLPILCGSFGQYVQEDGSLREASPSDHPQIADAIGLLQQVALHRRTVFIAAADLSHVGPAFGDEDPADDELRKEIEKYDSELMSAVIKGQQGTFLETVRSDDDDSRVCGLAPIYMTLWAAGEISDSRWMGYQQCAADVSGSSFVSIAGGLLY